MRVREELNKLKIYVHAAGGKRFKFEYKPSFFSLSGCSTTVHLLDHRHFLVLDVVVIGQIKMLGHGKTSSMIAGIMIVSLHRPKVLTKTVWTKFIVNNRTGALKTDINLLFFLWQQIFELPALARWRVVLNSNLCVCPYIDSKN